MFKRCKQTGHDCLCKVPRQVPNHFPCSLQQDDFTRWNHGFTRQIWHLLGQYRRVNWDNRWGRAHNRLEQDWGTVKFALDVCDLDSWTTMCVLWSVACPRLWKAKTADRSHAPLKFLLEPEDLQRWRWDWNYQSCYWWAVRSDIKPRRVAFTLWHNSLTWSMEWSFWYAS